MYAFLFVWGFFLKRLQMCIWQNKKNKKNQHLPSYVYVTGAVPVRNMMFVTDNPVMWEVYRSDGGLSSWTAHRLTDQTCLISRFLKIWRIMSALSEPEHKNQWERRSRSSWRETVNVSLRATVDRNLKTHLQFMLKNRKPTLTVSPHSSRLNLLLLITWDGSYVSPASLCKAMMPECWSHTSAAAKSCVYCLFNMYQH